MNIWVVKCNDRQRGERKGWHWFFYFFSKQGARAGLKWGGANWIRSPLSQKYLREEVRSGDIVVCYQTDLQAILGFSVTHSSGYKQPGSGRFNMFDLIAPREAFSLYRSDDFRNDAAPPPLLTIRYLREQGCNPKSFGPGTQGTIFPVTCAEFDGIIAAAKHLFPQRSAALSKWLAERTNDTVALKASVDVPIAAADHPSHGAGFGDPEQNRQVEEAAIRLVKRYYEVEGWRVHSVEPNKCGYDLLCRLRDQERHVEVKGVRGKALTFIISANEVQCAQKDPLFCLQIVTGALDERPQRREWTGKAFLRDFVRRPLQFMATLKEDARPMRAFTESTRG